MSDEYPKLVRQTAHGSLSLLIGQLISTIILTVSTIIVAYVLGPVQYGSYTKVFVPVSIALLFTDPGIQSALTRYVSLYHREADESELSKTITTGLLFSLTVATIIAAALFLLASPISTYLLQQPDLDQQMRVVSFTLIGQTLLGAANAVFIGFMRTKLQNVTTILYSIIKGITSITLVLLGLGPMGAVIGHVSAYMIVGASALIFALFYLRATGLKRAHLSSSKLRELLRFGLPIYLSNLIAGGLTQFTNSVMVLYVLNAEIGNYGTALNFVVLLNLLTAPIQTTIYPLFSRIKRDSPDLKHAYQNAVKYSSLFALPGVLVLIGLSHPMIGTIYGERFPDAALFLSILVISYIPIGVGSTCQGNLLNSQGETRVNMWKGVISLAVGAPLAVILIPRFGIIGLIASTIASGILPTIYGHIWIKRHLKLVFESTSSAKIYISSASALAATLASQYLIRGGYILDLIIGLVTFAIVYLGALKITRTLTEQDYDMFRSILGTTGPLSKPLEKLLSAYENL